MAFKHGKDTYISIDSDDISVFTNTSELEVTVDEHDVTCYGADDHAFSGGLRAGAVTMGGIYDDTASGPKAILEPLIDAAALVTLIRRPEGTGTGLPQESLSVLVKRYVETNPVADMITWSCEMTKSGAITRTTQA